MVQGFWNGAGHAWAAAIAGPALMWAGWKYPGSNKAKLLLVGIGVVLVGAHAPYLKAEANKLLPG